jgi:aspartyl-tRNA(Asn)/glutamyl-tRNA(Gln) amidotransferase subunit C
MSISREETLKIARLARLELPEKELDHFSRQLSSILDYIDKLNQLDTSEVPSTYHSLELETPLRRDIPRDPLPAGDILRSAPERKDDFFAVPKIIDSNESV